MRPRVQIHARRIAARRPRRASLRSAGFLVAGVLGVGATTVCGCTLLTPMTDALAYRPTTGGTRNLLAPLRPGRDALQIDVVFVERPVGDPILGNTLWKDVDQAAFGPEERDALKKLGLLMGNAGATLCPALERLLRETVDPLDATETKNCMPLRKQTICLGSSEESPIVTNALEHATVTVPLLAKSSVKTYNNFKSVLRLRSERVQDGWAKLEFAPEIHHGVKRLRPTAAPGDADWQARDSQEIDRLPQRISARLHVGEMVVITAAPDDPLSFGHSAFVRDDRSQGPVQRILVVRLSNMARLDPVYARSNLADRSNLAEQNLPARK